MSVDASHFAPTVSSLLAGLGSIGLFAQQNTSPSLWVVNLVAIAFAATTIYMQFKNSESAKKQDYYVISKQIDMLSWKITEMEGIIVKNDRHENESSDDFENLGSVPKDMRRRNIAFAMLNLAKESSPLVYELVLAALPAPARLAIRPFKPFIQKHWIEHGLPWLEQRVSRKFGDKPEDLDDGTDEFVAVSNPKQLGDK